MSRAKIWATLACAAALSACGAESGTGGGAADSGAGGGGGGGTDATPQGGQSTGGMPLGGAGGEPGGGEPPPDARQDAAAGGAVEDAALPPDAAPDATGGALADARVPDAAPETGPPDGGEPDATPDASLGDAALPDLGSPLGDPCHPGALHEFNELAQADADGLFLDLDLPPTESAMSGSCGGDGPERAFRFVAPEAGRWRFLTEAAELGASFDTVLYTRSACPNPDTQTGCNDDYDGQFSAVDLELVQNEELYLIVDAYRAGARGTARLRALQERAVGQGGACDAGGFPRACEEGLLCARGAAGTVCLGATAPVVTSATLWINPLRGRLGLEVAGLDPEDNVEAVTLALRDAAGRQVLLALREPALNAADGAFTFAATGALPGQVPVAGEVVATDSTGLASEPFALEAVRFAEVAGAGDPCDPEGLRAACALGLSCTEAPDATFRCALAALACPGTVADLHAAAPDAGGRYVFDGDTTGAADAVDGVCAFNASGEQLVRFVVPEDGRWTFTVDATAGDEPISDSILSVLSGCQPTAETSLGCNDDAGGVETSRVADLSLRAGTPVFLLVEGFAQNEGTYRLSAERTGDLGIPPVLDAAALRHDPGSDRARVSLRGTAGTGDVTDVRMDLYAAGALIGWQIGLDLPEAAPAGQPFDLVVGTAGGQLGLLHLADTAHLRVLDTAGGQSAVIVAPVDRTPPAVLARGEACDGDPFDTGTCALGDLCANTDADPETAPICAENTPECPAAWGAQPIPGPPFTIEGDTTTGPFLPEARCGRGNGARVSLFTFTAPEAATWTFRTDEIGNGDTVLGIRGACMDVASELACDDDGAGMRRSQAEVALEAGQTVYVGIWAFGEASAGPFTLIVEPAAP